MQLPPSKSALRQFVMQLIQSIKMITPTRIMMAVMMTMVMAIVTMTMHVMRRYLAKPAT